jgi:hypothetical protein
VPTRRMIVIGALAAACVRRVGVGPAILLDGSWLFGWRLVPGQTLVYRTTSRRESPGGVQERGEEWTFRVLTVDDDDVAALVGRCSGDSTPEPSPEVVRLGLSSDGRLLSCSAVGPRALTHRLLAMRLPTSDITVGSAWDDPDLARPFLDLFPAGTADRVSAEVRLAEVRQVGDDVHAVFVTEGAVGAALGGRIDLQGTATFDAPRGRLVRRDLTARFESPNGSDRLQLTTELVRSG